MVSAQTNTQADLVRKINEFLKYLQVERAASPLTIRNYKHYLLRFANWLENKKGLEEIDQETIRDYRAYLYQLPAGEKKVLGMATQIYHVIALMSFLK